MLLPPLEITKRAWQIYRDNWSIFFKILVWLFVPAILLGILAFFDERLGLAFADRSVPIYLGLVAFAFVVNLWAQVVLTRLIKHSLSQEPVHLASLRGEAWRDTLPLLWVHILIGLIIFLLPSVLIFLGIIFSFFNIVFLAILLCVFPGLMFAFWYTFSAAAFILDGSRGMEALRTSKKLVVGRFWPVVWRLIIATLPILVVLIILLGVPTLILGFVTGFSGFTSDQNPWWFDILQSLAAYLILPLTYGVSVVLFQDLKKNPQSQPVVPPATQL